MKKYRSRRLLWTVFLLCGALAGYLAGARMPEERRSRMKKLLFEAKEMPFRVFV